MDIAFDRADVLNRVLPALPLFSGLAWLRLDYQHDSRHRDQTTLEAHLFEGGCGC